MTRCTRLLSAATSIAIGMLVAGGGASADPNPGTNDYALVSCITGPPNGQCPTGDNSYVRAPDPGIVGFDILQPVQGHVFVDVSGTDADIVGSVIGIDFVVDLPGLGSVTTKILSRIEGAIGTVVGDDIQWTGTQEFISNGIIDCQIIFMGNPACTFFTDYVDGVNVFVEGRNVTKNGPGPAEPTPITLPDFPFSGDGSSLLHTGEFNINKPGESNLFLALEATFVPEPGSVAMLVSGVLLLLALERRRVCALR